MKPLTRLLTLLIALFAALPARAELEALIALHGDDDAWSRQMAVQDLLTRSYGFDGVRILTDATPEEITGRIKSFLEAPNHRGDHRLVWISGPGPKAAGTPCPAAATGVIRPAVPALVLAPDCFTDVVRFPTGARHFGLTTPRHGTRRLRGDADGAAAAPALALLNLPSDGAPFVKGADAIVLETLQTDAEMGIDPLRLLAALRANFRWNGSDYAPALDLYGLGNSQGPFRFATGAAEPRQLKNGRPARIRGGRLKLFASPDPNRAEAIAVGGIGRVHVLRHDGTGRMRYVAAGRRFFGWVKADDLAL